MLEFRGCFLSYLIQSQYYYFQKIQATNPKPSNRKVRKFNSDTASF